MNKQNGVFIIVEGPDGVGKSSVVRDLTKVIEARHAKVVNLAFPGRQEGTLGLLVYKLHHDLAQFGIEGITPVAVQALHVAAHLDVITTVIKPLLANGTTVVLDRFWWSTWVYGTVNGIDQKILHNLIESERCAWGSCVPNAAILLERQSPLRPEPHDIWEKLKIEYAKLSAREAEKYPVYRISNDGEPKETLNSICQILAEDLEK